MGRPSPMILVGAASLALAAAFSCKTFDLPAETCDPSTLDAKRDLQSDGDCSRCLEDRCCDEVGECERKDGCGTMVRATQKCVLDHELKGAEFEKECARETVKLQPGTKRPANQEADGAYRCMRANCGAQCGLPVCKVDQAARLIRNAKCDGCFAGGCCGELNRCYASRACKLMLECIIGQCGDTLGTSLQAAARDVGGGDGSADIDPAKVCDQHAKNPASFGDRACVFGCLCKYADNDQGLPPAQLELQPFNLARDVYVCGGAARCGEECAMPPDNTDAPDARNDQ